MATFTKQSIMSGKVHTMDVDGMSQEEFDKRLEQWQNGMLIQDAFPEFDSDQREFIMTGITPDEWAMTFGDDDE